MADDSMGLTRRHLLAPSALAALAGCPGGRRRRDGRRPASRRAGE
ncbi:hypothetical protein [Haloarcula nitratireducens]|nr:hypothetical protein [Halomicroarcula nitratireducens]